ncbi:MAG: MauE/DoxX family redox-associated membrane protein [Candidatus Tectimicrobiota bacterium]
MYNSVPSDPPGVAQRLWVACTRPWIVLLLRLLVGGVFLLSGFSKLLLPHAEVVALVEQYQVLPAWLVSLTALVLPWLEVASGAALVVGFYTTPVACLLGLQLVNFIVLMVIVLASGIVIEDCGCFGKLSLHETPLQVLIRDLCLLGLLLPILYRQRDALSVDAWVQAADEQG